MKKIQIICLLITMVMIFAACQSEHTKKSLNKINELTEKAEELSAKINTPEISDYKLLYDTIKHYNQFFLNLPESFEENEENFDIIYKYGAVEKTFKWLHINFINVYNQDLEYSKSQLANLRQDILNKQLAEDEIDMYIQSEDSALNALEISINATLDYTQEHYDIYIEYQPKVLNLIEEYGVEL
jgi:inorganic pyrophosphatase